MNYDFNKVVRSNSISIEAVKDHAKSHICELEDFINRQKAIAANSEEEKNIDDDDKVDSDFTDGMILNMVLFSAISSLISGNMVFLNAFNGSSAAAYLEGAALIMEDRDNALAGKLYDYPKGRASFKGKKSIVDKGFNIVSKSKKKCLNRDKKADRRCMYEILDMSKKLEKEGISYIEISEGSNIYDCLKKADKEKAYSGGLVRHYDGYLCGNA